MKNSNYEDYEQMSTEMMNSKYNNIGFSKKSRSFFTKRKIFIIVISLSLLILILYLIFRPSKKSQENANINNQENTEINKPESEFDILSKKEEELKSEKNKLLSQKENIKKENDDLDKQIKEFNDKNKKSENDKKNEEKEINDKKDKIKEYEKKVNEIKEKIEQLNKKGKELKDKKEENDKEIKSLESKIEELEKELKIEDKKDDNQDKNKEQNNTNEEKKDNNKEEKKEENNNTNKNNEQPQPSNPELAARIDSKIIMEIKQLELLDKWWERKLKFKLLYRATEEKYSASEFHKKVDQYKNTIILIKDINNFIYGGFTTKTWDGNKIFKTDKNSILFNLDKEKYYEVKDDTHAIFCDKDLLVVFGDRDLVIGPNSIESNFPKCYGSTNDKNNDLTLGYNKLSPVELEVFQLS